MTEHQAREALLVRAFDQQPPSDLWTEDDRRHASQEARRQAGPDASAERFVATRAAVALSRLDKREPGLAEAVQQLAWRPWIGPVVMLAALLSGLALDAAGAGNRINILNPPLLLILAWNLLTYLVLAFNAIWPGKAQIQSTGLARLLARVATGQGWRARSGAWQAPVHAASIEGAPRPRDRTASAPIGPGMAGHEAPHGERHGPATHQADTAQQRASVVQQALSTFRTSWFKLAAPLYGQKAISLLHAAAMLFALGALGGLYLRGLAFEYRAGWESTFLNAEQVSALLHWLWGAASSVTGIPLPDATQLEAMRFPDHAGANAAPWIHLQTLTVLLVVVLPRLGLALWHQLRARRLSRHFPLPLDERYFKDLLRQQRGESAVAWVLPYSYTVPEAQRAGLLGLLSQLQGGQTQLRLQMPLALGEEDELQAPLPELAGSTLAVALFSLSATPEAENHATFLSRLSALLPPGMPLVALVDESSFRARFGADTHRLDSRRSTWRRILATHSDLPPVFVDLGAATDATVQQDALQTLEGLLAGGRHEAHSLH
ncbi:MAG: DUF2868 domain-containing protein [Lautropia sp.]|nr:DUF2868 domain-containing protein [Lautropia sp.]